MRDKNRIDPFIQKLNFEKFVDYFYPNIIRAKRHLFIQGWLLNKENLIEIWKDDHDLRFGQLLINHCIIDNSSVVHLEEDEILNKINTV
jgi:hypothetical protein